MNDTAKEPVLKCPSCGEVISGLSRVCPSCDFVISAPASHELDDELGKLEDAIITLKSLPQPNAANTAFKILLCCGTAGIYIVYKKLLKREHIFDFNKAAFNLAVANAEKEIRSLRNSYGANKEIAKLIADREVEMNNCMASRKKYVTIGRVVTIVFFVIVLLVQRMSPVNDYLKVQGLLKEGKIKEAKEYVANLKDEYLKADLEVEIKGEEINTLIKEKKITEAITIYNTIKGEDSTKSSISKVINTAQVKMLVDQKKFDEAKAFVASINDKTVDKASLLKLITYGEIESYAANGQADLALSMIRQLDGADTARERMRNAVVLTEVDRLLSNEKYDDALRKVKFASDEKFRDKLIEKIVTAQVDALITVKKYGRARARAGLIKSYQVQQGLLDKIDFEEKINK